MNTIIHEKYPNAKFIIIKYPANNNDDWYISTSRWKELEQETDIKVYDAGDLSGVNLKSREYILDDGHPNKHAWEMIIPNLSKKLNNLS